MALLTQPRTQAQETLRGRRRIVVLGSTGSVGTSCLDVITALADRLELVGISAHSNWPALAQQIERHRPRWAAITDENVARGIRAAGLNPAALGTQLLVGQEGMDRMVSDPEVDTVVVAIVGAAGLFGTWAALEAGKTVAVANKETLVMAGPLVMELVARSGATILPVDSEHSAIFQILQTRSPLTPTLSPGGRGGGCHDVERVVLTASGGPFRGKNCQDLQRVTVQEALQHPTWRMGPKITVDSATLMNKALEIIEARWLFDLAPEQIEVVIHPESVVHSFVEFKDGSVLAQLSPPDMRLPIQFALTYPERVPGPARRLDWKMLRSLTFERPDVTTFPALQLGYEVARRGGTCGAVLNAANEAAVGRFLAGTLRFVDIARVCREVLDRHEYRPGPTLTDLVAADRWARQEVEHWENG